ncbi:MAG: hypothetical protein JRE47_06455 [Deltaproteobacteria bacterium]|nr:hypothetical protein [Deltaproteobacteria bacterium]
MKSLRKLKTDFKVFSSKLKDPKYIADSNENVKSPPGLISFLAKLNLLYGLPFNYLVPEEKILPPESLRIFYLDINWINSLIDGACSVARFTSSDKAHDQGLRDKILSDVHQYLGIDDSGELPVTGLLIRSSVVSGWPGLKINAYVDEDSSETPGNKLKILRMDSLSSDVLLCMVYGSIGYIEIHEPAEGLHFGVDMPDNPEDPEAVFHKELKYLNSQGGHMPGEKMDGVSLAVPFRETNKRVIEISQLAENMKDEIGGTDVFTSAEFALQMIEGVENVTFQIRE